ncbi:hypothetical protein ACHAXS_003870 [Conticribra weissflogii]
MYSHQPSTPPYEEAASAPSSSQQAQRMRMLERQRQVIIQRRQNQMNSASILRTTNSDSNHIFRPSSTGIKGGGRSVVSVTSTVSELRINDGDHQSSGSYALQHQHQHQSQHQQQYLRNQEQYMHPNHDGYHDRIIDPSRRSSAPYNGNRDGLDGGLRLQEMGSNQRMTHPQPIHGGYSPASGIGMSQLPSTSHESMMTHNITGMLPAENVTHHHTPQLIISDRGDFQSSLHGQGVRRENIVGTRQHNHLGIRHQDHYQIHREPMIIGADSSERRVEQRPLLLDDSRCTNERAMTETTPMVNTIQLASSLNSPSTSVTFDQKFNEGNRQIISGDSSNLISSNQADGTERKGSKLKRSHSTRSLTFQEDSKGTNVNASTSVEAASDAVQNSTGATKSKSYQSTNRKGSSFLSNMTSINDLNLDDPAIMREFLTRPCPKGIGTVQCFIRRNKGIKNALFPEYRVYLKAKETFLMTSKKRTGSKTSNYLISMGRNDLDKNSANIIGKLRSNFLGTEYVIYDNGRNPEFDESYYEEKKCCDGDIRCELGAIMYSSNTSLGSKGPRKMKVFIGKVDNDGSPLQLWQPVNKCDAKMLTSFKAKNPKYLENLVVLENKLPSWSDEVGGYVLNFNGRVSKASVKNFQLVEESDDDNVILLFGRVGKDEFSLDVKWPMSPFQAFALALSSFDSKLGCD